MTDEELLDKLGKRIKQLRKEKNLSQIALAVELNYEKSNMSRLESGRVDPRLTTLNSVARAFDIPLSELLKFD